MVDSECPGRDRTGWVGAAKAHVVWRLTIDYFISLSNFDLTIASFSVILPFIPINALSALISAWDTHC
jgi:hypothetical protein